MDREGRYGPSIITATPNNRIGRYDDVSEEPQISTPIYNKVTPSPTLTNTSPKPVDSFAMKPVTNKYGLPESYLSEAKPKAEEKPSIWNRLAKTVLPKSLEDRFGLNGPQEPTAQERVMQAEDAKQYYWAGEKSGLSGFVDSITDWDRKDVPYIGSGIEAIDLVKVATAANRFEKGTQTESDVALLDKYITEADKQADLNKNKGYAVGETVKGSIRFMGELALVALTEIGTGTIAPTGDAYVAGQVAKLGAKKTIEKMLKDKAFRTAVNTAVKNTIKKEIPLLTKQFLFTAPTNVTGSAAERMIGTYDLETGEVIEKGMDIGQATVNALTQHAVELATERGGGITGKLLGRMAAPLKKIAVKTAIYQALAKHFPKATNAQLVQLIQKSGWNGPLSEFWEERDADAFNHLLFKMGLGDQEFQGLTMDQITTELIAFSIMGGGISAAQKGVENSAEFIMSGDASAALRDQRGFVKIPGVKEEAQTTPKTSDDAINVIKTISLENGIVKDVQFTDGKITDQINNQEAPSGVIPGEGKIVINRRVLQEDLDALNNGEKFEVRGKVIDNVNDYLRELVTFEEDNIKNSSVDTAQKIFDGGQIAKDVSKKLDIKTNLSPEQKSLFATEPKEKTSKEVPVESLMPPVEETVEPKERVSEKKKRTPLMQIPGIIDLFRTPWRVFEKMGLSEAYHKLQAGYDAYMKELPKNIDKITEWSKRVSKGSNQKIFKYLDGQKGIQLDANELQVANEIKAWLRQWADRLGMDPDARITDYITHIFPAGRSGEIPEEIAYMISKSTPGSVYNPFLLERLGAEGYIEDTWRALDAYTKRATRKVNMDPGLAAVKEASLKLKDQDQLKYVDMYLSRVNLRPSVIDRWIDTSLHQLFGYKYMGVRPTASLTRSIRMMIARAKIGGSMTSFAKNLTQGVNTFAELGPTYTSIGYANLVTKRGAELNEEGVLIAPFIEDRKYNAVKGAIEKVDKVLFLNMNASEWVNRGAAYYGAKAKFLDGKTSKKDYRMAFGKEMPENYTPNERDAREYGKYVAAKTQFKFGAIDTPVAMNSDLMKMVFQFQTFGLKQAEFIAQMAKDKEYAKLVRYTIASAMMFELVGSAFGMGWEDIFKTWRLGPPPAWQFFKDLYDSGVTGKDKYGNYLSNEDRVKAAAGTIFTNVIPAGAQMKRTSEGYGVVKEGEATTRSGRTRHIVEQTPSNYIRGSLFGQYNLPDAQEYYKEKEQKAKDRARGNSNEGSREGRY